MRESYEQPWVDGLTIDQVFRKTAVDHADQLAIVFHDTGWQRTWAELDDEVERAARGLLALGIGTGDHVAVWATNVPQWVILQFATARIGAVLVAVNPACRAHELAYALRRSDAKALFFVNRFKSSDYIDLLLQACPEIETARNVSIHCVEFPKLERIVLLRGELPAWASHWDEMLQHGEAIESGRISALANSLTARDPINIQYTSGTTGLPKAAMLSHRNLLMNAFYVGQRQKLTSGDRICIPVPFYHCFGCVLANLCAAVYGSAMLIPSEFFNARQTLETIDRYRASALYGVPTMFIAELQEHEL